MFNIITRKKEDPTEAFSGIWLNESTNTLWVWNEKPMIVGLADDGSMVTVEVFECEFVHTLARNDQKYLYSFPYDKVPLMVLAQVQNNKYDGSNVNISFGSKYGEVLPGERFVVVNQMGNVEIGKELTVDCEPKNGKLRVNVFVISYE